MTENERITAYVCKIREKAPNTHQYQEDGYNRTYVANSLDDAVAWLTDQSEGAESRFFDYIIEETEVVQ
jgi:hypothetical protein